MGLLKYRDASSSNPLECSTDCYIHFTEGEERIASSRKMLNCTFSAFGPKSVLHNHRIGCSAHSGDIVTVDSAADLFEQEHYLSVDPPADTLAHARSVFISEISEDVSRLLAIGLIESPSGIHCTLHIQQGG